MIPKFKAKILNGKMEIQDKARLQEYYRKFEGQDVAITVAKWSSMRSLQQNKYLHGVVFKSLSDYTGYTIQESKDIIKHHIGFVREYKINGEKHITLKETSKLTKKEFTDFVKKAKEYLYLYHNITIPSIDEIDIDSLYYIDNY